MRCAKPSTMAVLPTPGSPISTGLFLVRRCSTWIARRISSSRPITGSSLPALARSVKSTQYFFSDSRCSSASALSTFWPPRTAAMADSRLLRVRPCARAALPKSDLLSARASKNSSPATNWSPRLIASFSAACKSETRSRPTCTWSCPWTSGSFLIAVSATPSSPVWLTPARCNKALGPSSWCSMADTTWAGSIKAWSFPRARVWASDRAS